MGQNSRTAFLTAALALAGCSGLSDERAPPVRREAWLERILEAEDRRDGGDPLLAQAAVHADPVVQRTALLALGRCGGSSGVAALARVLAQGQPPLAPAARAEALFALGLTGSVDAFTALLPFENDPEPGVRASAATAFGLLGDERGLLPLVASLDDGEPAVRGAAALAVARLAAARKEPFADRPFEAFRAIGARLSGDADPGVRWKCAYAAGKLGRAEFRAPLFGALNDSDPLVRAFALAALAELEPEPAMAAGIADQLQDGDWRVAVEAAKALGKLPGDTAARALAGALPGAAGAGHPSHHVRAAAAESLGRMSRDGAAVAALETALSDPSESVRGAALESLAALGDPAAEFERLLALARGRASPAASRYLAARAARAAAALPAETGYPVIEVLLASDDVLVRSAAVAALARFPGRHERAGTALAAALREDDVALRESAAAAAKALGAKDLLPALEAALEDSPGADFSEARVALLDAVAALGGESAYSALFPHLGDTERVVRRAARDAIASTGGAIPVLPQEPAVVRAATPVPGVDFAAPGSPPRIELVTNKGTVELELLPDVAPNHVRLFLDRAASGFYDGLTFHRLVPGFVVQGLDPRGDGYGAGGVSLRGEPSAVPYDRGVVGMPDAGMDSGGCQLFVTFRPQPRLDARYTVFARVSAGMDVVEELDVGDRVDYVLLP